MIMNKPLSSQERRLTIQSLQPFPFNIHNIADKAVLAAKSQQRKRAQYAMLSPDHGSVMGLLMNKPLSGQAKQCTSGSLQSLIANAHRMAEKALSTTKLQQRAKEQEERATERAAELEVISELANNKQKLQKDQWMLKFFFFILDRFPSIPDPRLILDGVTLVDLFNRDTREAENVQRDMIMFFTDLCKDARDMRIVRRIVADLHNNPRQLTKEVCELERHGNPQVQSKNKYPSVRTKRGLPSESPMFRAGVGDTIKPPSAHCDQGSRIDPTVATIEAIRDRETQLMIEEISKEHKKKQTVEIEWALAGALKRLWG